MVGALDTGSSAPGWRPGRGHCVVFMGKTLNSHSASLHPGVYKWAPANLMVGLTLRWTNFSCYGNRDKLQPGEPLGSYADFTYLSSVVRSDELV